MRRSAHVYVLLVLAILVWSVFPIARQAKALTVVKLTSPADSSKVTTAFPIFKWDVSYPQTETPKRFYIKLALDYDFNSVIWEDSTIDGSQRSKEYDGPSLERWKVYFWRMNVEVDSQTTRQVDTVTVDTVITYWQEEFTSPFVFFYTSATCLIIPDSLPTIQEGISWAASGDTVLVKPGTYYENLIFYKKNILLTSEYLFDRDTATINQTVIDGSKLTRGEEEGSVVYFTSDVDSSSTLMGFTIRGGTGREVTIGVEDKVNGGGIFCDLGSTPTIAYNIITGNQAEHDGGGIFIYSAAPNILHNIITHNSTQKGSGGGIECYYSIQVSASASATVDGPGKENKPQASTEKPQPNTQIKKTLPSPNSRLEMDEEKIKNSLNPPDATEVHSLGKYAQNNPPVAVFNWYARRDTLIQRETYLPGDTLFFDGSGSSDPDTAEGDYIKGYYWQYLRHYKCWQDPPQNFSSLGTNSIYILPITETSGKRGFLKVFLLVLDSHNEPGYSDTLTFSIQNPPHADAGEFHGVAPGDTGWLDGTASCDVNPGDVLSYRWTQLSGPKTLTIGNADSAEAYIVPPDTSYQGIYEFQLMVADSLDTSFATVKIGVSNAPVPVCQDDPIYGDTLVGYSPQDSIPLDASASYDPDGSGQIKYYIWEPVGKVRLTETGYDTSEFVIQIDSTKQIQKFKYRLAGGGLLLFHLWVRDSLGVRSVTYDEVLISIQDPPLADAGSDTLLRPGSGAKAYLRGRALDINPDQRSTVKFNWSQLSGPTSVILYDSATTLASDTSRSVYFEASVSGRYKFGLIVDDRFALSEPDTVEVIINQLPEAKVVNVAHAFEGDTVILDASSSEDPDSQAFEEIGLTFNWSAGPPPPEAEAPVLVDADQPIAKFVPYGTGTYQFRVWVNDPFSENQPPDSSSKGNVAFLSVQVDSTYAYPVIEGNLISYNISASRGGGIDCNQSSPDIINNIFYKNQSKLSGGGICGRNFSTPQIKRNIFFGNISSDSTGGGIADLRAQLSPSATRGYRKNLLIQYNDFWDNRGGALYQPSGNILDNIYEFPRLIDPDFGDFRFECSSPCIGDSLHPDIGILIYFQPDTCVTIQRLKMVSFSLLQNPVATAVAHFIVNTDVPLKAPPVGSVIMGGNAPSPVYFVPISSKTYRGSFVFTSSGDAKVSIFASSVLERDTTVEETMTVQLIGAGTGGKLVNFDKEVEVYFPDGSVKKDIYATCIDVSKDSRYQFTEEPEMVAFGEAYQLGPPVSFDKDLTISFSLDDPDLKDKNKTCFSIYRYEDGKWIRLESFLQGNSIHAKTRRLGVFRLIYDPAGKHLAGIPKTFQLFQNYPNPFNPQTRIRYDLPVSGHVKLIIYNVLGQKVKVLVDQIQDAGHKSVIWDGRDQGGQEVASGIYFYKIIAENFHKTKKMVLLK